MSGSDAMASRLRLAAQPPEQPVEKSEPVGVGMAEDGFGTLDELARHREQRTPAVADGQIGCRSELAALDTCQPMSSGRTLVQRQPPCRVAPAGEIRLAGQAHVIGQGRAELAAWLKTATVGRPERTIAASPARQSAARRPAFGDDEWP